MLIQYKNDHYIMTCHTLYCFITSSYRKKYHDQGNCIHPHLFVSILFEGVILTILFLYNSFLFGCSDHVILFFCSLTTLSHQGSSEVC
jgi:hypothetical protein